MVCTVLSLKHSNKMPLAKKSGEKLKLILSFNWTTVLYGNGFDLKMKAVGLLE